MDAQTAVTTPAPEATYRLRPGVWERIAEEMGWPSYLAASRDLGVTHSTISRVVSGETVPGERFMAALMRTLPRSYRFEDVFELAAEEAD